VGRKGGVAKLLPRLSLKSLSRILDDAALPENRGGTIDEIDECASAQTRD
jgi:hypothetical protein